MLRYYFILKLFIAGVLVHGGICSAATICDQTLPENITYQTLRSWISECNPHEVGELVKHLPKNFKANASFVFKSDAESEKAHPGTVDYIHPRVILFGTKDLIITYTGKPNTPSYSELQLMEHQPGSGNIDFKTIRFNRFMGGAEINEHPASCVQCHGNPAHPIWARYNQWPGTYGSNVDTFINRAEEKNHFIEFLKTWTTSTFFLDPIREENDGRYSELLTSDLPWSKRHLQNDHELFEGSNYSIRPNAVLGYVLTEMYESALGEKFARRLNDSENMKELFLWRYFSCHDKTVEENIQYLLKTPLPDSYNPVNKNDPRPGFYDVYLNYQKALPMDPIFKKLMKVEPSTLTLEFKPSFYFYNSGFQLNQSYSRYSLSSDIPLSQRVYDHTAELLVNSRYLPTYSMYEYYTRLYGPTAFPSAIQSFTYADKPDPQYCGIIAKKIKKLIQVKKERPRVAPKVPLAISLSPLKSNHVNSITLSRRSEIEVKTPFAKCTRCHDGSPEAEGPTLDFLNANQNPALKAKIIDQITNGYMPKNGSLSENEFQAIVKDLNR